MENKSHGVYDTEGNLVALDKNSKHVDNGSYQMEIDTYQRHDPVEIERIKNDIDITKSSMVMSYGNAPMAEIARFSNNLLEGIKGKDAGVVGGQLNELIMKVKEYDPLGQMDQAKGFLASIPLIGKLFRQAQMIQIDNMTLASQVDTIASHLDHSMVGLMHDNEKLELLYNQNFEHYKAVDAFVRAGKMKLAEVKANELAVLQERVSKSNDLLDAQNMKDMLDHINRFERRIHDLELSKTISMQTAPQIRIIQNNNQQLAEKINNSIFTTLPIWKSQMVLSATLEEQSKAVELQRTVTETTNDLLRKNAEILQQNSIATAKETERSVIDIETVREVQTRLVSTIEETMKIATDARVKRLTVETELQKMEENLKNKITEIVHKEEEKRSEIQKRLG